MNLKTTLLLTGLLVAAAPRLWALDPKITSETDFYVQWPIQLVNLSEANNPGAALDANPATEWDTYSTKDFGFIIQPQGHSSVVTGLRIACNPNNNYYEDPANFTLEGSPDGVTWTMIGSGNVAKFPVTTADRLAAASGGELASEFTINNTNFSAYYYYRVMIPDNRGIDQPPDESGHVNADAAQIGTPHRSATRITTISLHGTVNSGSPAPTLGFIVQPLDMAAEAGQQYGAVAIANQNGVTYTWKTNGTTAYTSTDTYTTHADFKATVLPGSDYSDTMVAALDGATVTVEASLTANPTAVSRNAKLTLLGAKVTGPATHVIRFPMNRMSPPAPPWNQTVDSLMDGILSNDSKTHWKSPYNGGFWIQPADGKTVVNGFSVSSANDWPNRDPKNYVFEGSDDGTNWVMISSGDMPVYTYRLRTRGVGFPLNTTAYYFYRITFPTVWGPRGQAGGVCQLAELHLHGTVVGPNNPPFAWLGQATDWGIFDQVWGDGFIYRPGYEAETGIATTKGTSALTYQWYVDGIAIVDTISGFNIGTKSWLNVADDYNGIGSGSWAIWGGPLYGQPPYPWSVDGSVFNHSYHCVATCGSLSYTSAPLYLKEIAANRLFIDSGKVWWTGAEGATLKVSDNPGGPWVDAPAGNPLTLTPSATPKFYRLLNNTRYY